MHLLATLLFQLEVLESRWDDVRLQPHERLSAARFKNRGPFHGFCADPALRPVAQSCGTDPHARPGTVNRMATVGILFQCLATVDWLGLRFTPDWTPRTQLMICSLWMSNAMRVVGWTGGSRVGG